MNYKCKMCGAPLTMAPGSHVATCEYCGTAQTVPAADNEKKISMMSRAERLRFRCEFDKASGMYESVVSDFPEEAEAYWGLLLCKYGIEYVEDPKTGKRIPTCHRSSFESVTDDVDYHHAMKCADALAKEIYRQEAAQIEQLRLSINEITSKEEPYDIFICYKETDEKGKRTLDSALAQEIYDMLTEKGYKVFFSRISLEEKLGTEYEPYIFAALNSAKVMLMVCTDTRYAESVWVRNEWSRYLKLIAGGEKKYLIPCYKNISPENLPEEFARLQAQNLGKVGAMQDLLRGIEKIIPRHNEHGDTVVTEVVNPLKDYVLKNKKKVIIGAALVLALIIGLNFLGGKSRRSNRQDDVMIEIGHSTFNATTNMLVVDESELTDEDYEKFKSFNSVNTLSFTFAADNLEGLSKLPDNIKKTVTELNIYDYGNSYYLDDIEGISGFTAVKKLTMSSMHGLPENLSALKNLPNLEHFESSSEYKGINLLAFSESPHLKVLKMRAPYLEDLNGIENLTEMENLELDGDNSAGIHDLQPLSGMTHLKTLYLPENADTTPVDISSLTGLTELTDLIIDPHVSNLDPLRDKDQLRTLILGKYAHRYNMDEDVMDDCYRSIEPVGSLTSLEELVINMPGSLTDITPLGNLKKLVKLELYWPRSKTYSLTDISPIGNLTELRELQISSSGDATIKDLRPLQNCTKLKKVIIYGVSKSADSSFLKIPELYISE